MYGDGLFITCTDKTSIFYHIKVDDTTFSQVNWYHLSNCNFFANWVVDITGNNNVTFKGSSLPAIVERLVYNVLGSGRYINVVSSIYGSVLAPYNNFYMPNGVSLGFVVVANVINSRQNNKPNCVRFNPVLVYARLARPVHVGDTLIFVVDFGNIIIGDTVCWNGNCQKVVAFYQGDFDGNGSVDYAIGTSNGSTVEIPSDSLVSTTVDPQNPGDRSSPQTTNPFSAVPTDSKGSNDATTVVISSALLVLSALIF